MTNPGDRPTLISRERVYDGRLVHLHVDSVRLPSNRETTREVIEHPGATVILPVASDGRIWFVRQYRYAIDEELLELPAGLIEAGEEPAETARRELLEEVGLTAASFEPIGSLFPSAGYSNERVHIFLATGCTPAPHIPLDEGLTIQAMDLKEVTALVDKRPFPFHNAATAFAVLWYIRHRESMP